MLHFASIAEKNGSLSEARAEANAARKDFVSIAEASGSFADDFAESFVVLSFYLHCGRKRKLAEA